MENAIIVAVLAVVVGAAVWYIRRAKKNGKTCIGCPDNGCCHKKDGGCCSR